MSEALSLISAASLLGVSPHTLRTWAYQGRIAYHKLGRRVVFDKADVQAFLKANRVEAGESGKHSVSAGGSGLR